MWIFSQGFRIFPAYQAPTTSSVVQGDPAHAHVGDAVWTREPVSPNGTKWKGDLWNTASQKTGQEKLCLKGLKRENKQQKRYICQFRRQWNHFVLGASHAPRSGGLACLPESTLASLPGKTSRIVNTTRLQTLTKPANLTQKNPARQTQCLLRHLVKQPTKYLSSRKRQSSSSSRQKALNSAVPGRSLRGKAPFTAANFS